MKSLLLLLLPSVAFAWGEDGHRIIADAARERLSPELRSLLAGDPGAFEEACIEPDRRRHVDPAENSRHYVDIERFSPQFRELAQRVRSKKQLEQLYQAGWPIDDATLARLYARVPRSRAGYEAWRGELPDDDFGTVLYAIADAQKALRAALLAHDGDAARKAAGDLCHYVGDLAQPMHDTANYRGQLSGNTVCLRDSVHERFESHMVRRFRKELALRVAAQLKTAEPIHGDDAVALAIDFSLRARKRLPEILDADRAIVTGCGGKPAEIDRKLYDALGALAAERLADATRLLVHLIDQIK